VPVSQTAHAFSGASNQTRTPAGSGEYAAIAILSSFLYAALACVVARLFGKTRIRFFENGVVSINLPISEQVVGARATRTTHPVVLERFRRFFGEPIEVDQFMENQGRRHPIDCRSRLRLYHQNIPRAARAATTSSLGSKSFS
jgi:hypothetical protein